MIVAGAVSSAYLLVAAIVWAWVAYTMGKHYGKVHGGEQAENCPEPACQNPVPITLFCSLLWPVFFVMGACFWWSSFWNTAGANATLPPENGHPTGKPPDVEFVE